MQNLKPQAQPPQPIDELKFPDKLPLLDELDRVIAYLDESTARQRIAAGDVTILRTKRKVRVLRLRERPALLPGAPTVDLTKWNVFSHPTSPGEPRREDCEAHPAGVWVFDPIPRKLARFFGVRHPVTRLDDGPIKRAA